MSDKCVNKLIIIGQQLYESIARSASEHFSIDVQLFDDSVKSCESQSEDVSVVYVTNDFFGDVFNRLMKVKKHIISSFILNECIEQNIAIPQPKHPLYNHFLKDAIICFSPISKSQSNLVIHYLTLIRFMNGQSRKDMKSGQSFDRTHLIECRTDSNNYRCAVIYGIPIVFKEWIDELWNNRNDPQFDPKDRTLSLKFKINPFYGLRLAFINFSNQIEAEVQERTQMEALTVEYGGEVVDPKVGADCTACSHFVVNATKDNKLIINFDEFERIPDYVVYKSWFTDSIHIKNREDEENYHYFPKDRRTLCRTPSSAVKSFVTSSGVLSPDYDTSFTTDSSVLSKSKLTNDMKTSNLNIKSKTYYRFLELFETENKYVNTLKAIIRIFRDPLKNHQLVGEFPNEIELKTIFGCFPPIIEVHERILLKLEKVGENWSEDNEIGKIFVEHSEQLLTVYPEYMNFLEKTKEMIDECIEKYPKFDRFLKVSQTDAVFDRFPLKDLVMNPFQRLLKYPTLLSELLKQTDETKSDYKSLNEAHSIMVAVNNRINRGKAQTEGQIKMFDMLNDIEDCPPTLLSSQRHFISKCDVKLLIQNESSETKDINKFDNYLFCLLLFTDLLILCKKRTLKRTNSLSFKVSNNYPNSTGVKKNAKKTYKHIETIELSSIKYILNDETEEFENSFAIITYPKQEIDRTFPTFPFMVKVPEFNKQKFLDNISQTLRELTSNEFQENIIRNESIKTLDFAFSNSIARSVSKSKYVIMRTKEKINRTFSVRRQSLTPAMSLESLHVPQSSLPPSSPSSSRRLSRVFSSFLSPIGLPNRTSNRYLGSMTSMTSLNENTNNEMESNFSLPTTPAPRKRKCNTNIEQNMQI